MALPTIQPYAMPVASDLPENRASWAVDPKRAVFLIHDMQQYFLNAFTPGESPVLELLANIHELRMKCRALGIPVIYTAQPDQQTPEQRGLLFDFWGSGLNDKPDQKHIVPELAPLEGDTVLTKWRYSGFRKTNLAEIMQEQGRDQLIVSGIYAHIGCLMTACEAFMQDIQPFFVADAVADFSLDNHKMALNYAAQRCAVTLTTQDVSHYLDADLGHSHIAVSSEQPLMSMETVREQVAKLLYEAPESLKDEDDLINEKGLDSIRIMSLVESWRREGAEVTFVELAEQPTLAKWWQLLASRLKVPVPNLDYFA
ncbi:isochorismatase family protein [Paenibacillus alba]|uniref:isochorismatase n=1 Tax=Paenibacillus alba TaxID=1197127 RepID=A0ABU6G4P4_9BACL|nr:isochorismatase family protein [Paenibacillus alba]MEC0228901.1 isochorismatase family protein [Paenibacillus alba]NQX71713.1 isochorismatase family protein [Paenibacillus alba]